MLNKSDEYIIDVYLIASKKARGNDDKIEQWRTS
jgi:hypothetical protein